MHFEGGMLVKVEISCLFVKIRNEITRVLNLSFEGMSDAKSMFFKNTLGKQAKFRRAEKVIF